MKELEIEFKNLLTGEEYGRLHSALFTKTQPIVQTNFYIDTPDLDLKHHRLLLRIRDTGGKQIMTLKEPTEKGVMEYHGEVENDLNFDRNIRTDEVPELILGELERFNIDTTQLKIYGALSTERREVPYREGLLVLDKNNFLDTEDFELEYEVDQYDKGETRFMDLLEQYSIERRKETTKVERFYNKLESIRSGDNYANTL
ncbi:CYTH domain-containing protein [Salinicoccus sp. ID82-1]|uniref:CYTH domain-containing protein n=1 Tax=Salinicoccus cyprini TaxID=2493691 RepID=A0A558AX19_9STAP|nr:MULTISPECIES: CYTH domain-containing protein [Salinicoccus]MCG1010029.1 CYTH domain-containing protein [Salinicoccus sp. ID82-1]TVT28803.1 CYTH domain-containing protein [Salinicoccus cyprini]